MKIVRQITVFDAMDVATESAFWAGLLGGEVWADETFHSVIVDGKWRLGIQAAANHVAPDWPAGRQLQQVHLDLHVEDLGAAHEHATSLGARLLKAADDPDADEGYRVYASPAGHPFCLGWHPSVPDEHDFGATRG
ncbi:MAG: VOC family protein [Nocardioidaceae bacterium]|nr:VOC family protein [Nocardioidaceae bacterium]